MLNRFLELMNQFPMKYWYVIYLVILLSHVISLYLGYTLSTLGFLISIVTYYILLTKIKLWMYGTFILGILMFGLFLCISVLKLFTNYLNFYEICLLLGLYEITLMLMFFKLPIKSNKINYSTKVLFIRNLFCIILLVTGIYYIPVGLYGIYKNVDSLEITGFIFPLYLIAVLIVVMSIISANLFNEEKINEESIKFLNENDQIDIGKINSFFSESKMYLKYNFTMNDLSTQIGIDKKRLSYLINSGMQKNYYKLIAYYRIEKAKELLEQEPSYTLDYISLQCGFTSTPVFIKYFKIFVGTTPKKYRDSVSKNN